MPVDYISTRDTQAQPAQFTDILLGGFWTPSVSVVDSLQAGTIMRQKAIDAGALTVSANTEVEDLEVAALCACTAMMRFFHPQMIAQCATKPGPTIDQMIDFVVAGLSPRARAH